MSNIYHISQDMIIYFQMFHEFFHHFDHHHSSQQAPNPASDQILWPARLLGSASLWKRCSFMALEKAGTIGKYLQ